MDFFEAVEKRRTIRDFENVEVSDSVLEKIIGAAFKAPTNDHLRDWHYVIVKDKAVAEKLLGLVPKTFSKDELKALFRDWNLTDGLQQDCYSDACPKQYRMLFEASAIIVPLLKQKTDILRPENVSHLNGFASIWCSIENIFLAATAEGLACNLRIPLGDEALRAREVLGFPSDYFMPCFIGIGKAKKDAVLVKQKEINLKERVHWNKF